MTYWRCGLCGGDSNNDTGLIVHREKCPLVTYKNNEVIGKVKNTLWVDNEVSNLPCHICGGEVVEFSIPSDIWNRVIRIHGRETDREYLCIHCFLNALRTTLGIPRLP